MFVDFFQEVLQLSKTRSNQCCIYWRMLVKHSGTFLKDMLHCFQEMCHSLYWNIAKSDATLLHLFKKNTILFQESTESIQEGSVRKSYCTYWSILRQSGVSKCFCIFEGTWPKPREKGPCSGTATTLRLSNPVSLCCISSKLFINLLYILSDLLSYSLDAEKPSSIALSDIITVDLPSLGSVGSLLAGRFKVQPFAHLFAIASAPLPSRSIYQRNSPWGFSFFRTFSEASGSKTDSPLSCTGTDVEDCEGFFGAQNPQRFSFFSTKHALNSCMTMSQQFVYHKFSP